MIRIVIAIFLVLQAVLSIAQGVDPKVVKIGNGVEKGWLFEATDKTKNKSLVIFLHGYGVSNPKSYGGWIKFLNQNGYNVLFPKFQLGIEPPRSRVYKNRVKELLLLVDELYDNEYDSLFFIGHSIGGVIAANICVDINKEEQMPVKGLLLVSPGHKKYKQDEYLSYDSIGRSVSLMVITGDKDRVAKDRFAFYVMEKTKTLNDKLFLKISDVGSCSSKHKEALSPMRDYSTKNWNLINSIAYKIGGIDEVDSELYWPISLRMLNLKKEDSLLNSLTGIEFPFKVITPVYSKGNNLR